MEHQDHVALLRPGIPALGGMWADLGAGTGAFTLALADIIGPTGKITAVDKDGRALRHLADTFSARFPQVTLTTITADFTRPLALPPLDGVVMANSLHFVRHKAPVLGLVRDYLRPDGRLLIVEYNTDRGNHWVPHPFSYSTWEHLAQQAGFSRTQRLHARPSRFLGEIYSAASWNSPSG
ncbi:MAG: class I SAM-dependent methyltransferase [Anaerolineales bacterium]|nr:class I SAM-dependent methyltransferase [Anaerolineales bacterium]